MITYTGFTWVQILTLVVSVVLPALVALVTKRVASARTKALLLALLAAVIGFLSELLSALNTSTPFDIGAAILLWLTSFVIAVASHYGLLKPTGVTGTDGVIQLATARAGIGPKHAARDDLAA